jgi:uncharacterized protein DUF2806
MDKSTSLIRVGDFAKPVDTLIVKISDAIGGLCKPWQIKRVAEAEAEAGKIAAVTQIEITELQRRAVVRFLAEEAKKQNNIESITYKALPQVASEAKPERMEDDWIANFFDKCRLISDEEMQTIWAKILAGEANAPGKFSKRTVNLLGSIDKFDAMLFFQLCSFVFQIGTGLPAPLVYNLNARIYTEFGLNFRTLTHLESTGLIHFDAMNEYLRRGLQQKTCVHYFGRPIWIEFPQPNESNVLNVGHAMFTGPGEELAPLCGAQPHQRIVEYVKEHWKRYGIKTEEPTPERVASAS